MEFGNEITRLEAACYTKIATILWEHTGYLEFNELVLYDIIDFDLLDPLKEELKVFIKIVGFEIVMFRNLLTDFTKDELTLKLMLSKIIWTTKGTINRIEVIKGLVNNEMLPLDIRFQMACKFCLEQDVRNLWPRLSSEHQKRFRNIFSAEHMTMENIWVYYLADNIQMDFNLLVLRGVFETVEIPVKRSVYMYSKEGVEFLFNKIHVQDRSRVLKAVCSENYNGRLDIDRYVLFHNEVAMYIFSLIENSMEELHHFKNFLRYVLRAYLYWPHQCNFLRILDKLHPLMNKSDNRYIMECIIQKIERKFCDYNYLIILKEMYRRSLKLSFELELSIRKKCLETFIESCDNKGVLLVLNPTLNENISIVEELKQFELHSSTLSNLRDVLGPNYYKAMRQIAEIYANNLDNDKN